MLELGKKMLQSLRQSLQTKLVMLFLLVAIIPLLVLGYLSYDKSSKMINKQFGTYGHNSVMQLQFQIDSILGQMKYITNDVLSYVLDPTFTVLHEEVPSSYVGFLEEQQLEQFLKAHKTIDTRGIYMITKSGYFYGDYNLKVDKLKEEGLFQRIRNDGEGFWFGLYKPQHYSDAKPDEWVIGLIFAIKNQVGILENSHVLVEMDAKKLLSLIRTYEIDTHSSVQITDGGGNTIYKTANSFAPQPNDMVWSKKSDATDWKIEVRTPYDQFYKSSFVIRSFTMVVIAFSALLALVLAYVLASQFIRRIKRIKESMNLVGMGKLDTHIPVDSEDELGRLSFSFNNMTLQIQSLISEVEQVERQKKDAELKAFHYQINPHLLLNTLNSIQWKARLSGNQEVNRMIHHLTRVLEGNLNFSKELNTLDEELRIIEHFLQIQELRYGKVFSYEIDAAGAELTQVAIPRMTLQPLVENIFFHGFEDGVGKIAFTIREAGDDVLITMQDNGKGIDPVTLAGLLEPPRETGKNTKRIGMYNVDQKIKLHFGYRYGLTIASEVGSGTTITIRLPKKEEESR